MIYCEKIIKNICTGDAIEILNYLRMYDKDE